MPDLMCAATVATEVRVPLTGLAQIVPEGGLPRTASANAEALPATADPRYGCVDWYAYGVAGAVATAAQVA